MRSPPSLVRSILFNPMWLMSTRRVGCSTSSFMRSTSVVPPATNRTGAPCCAVVDCAAIAIASEIVRALVYWKRSMFPRRQRCLAFRHARVAPHLLDGRNDVLVGAAAADVAAHQLLDLGVRGAAWLLHERDRRHDLPRR